MLLLPCNFLHSMCKVWRYYSVEINLNLQFTWKKIHFYFYFKTLGVLFMETIEAFHRFEILVIERGIRLRYKFTKLNNIHAHKKQI